jgi:hypothetical protein
MNDVQMSDVRSDQNALPDDFVLGDTSMFTVRSQGSTLLTGRASNHFSRSVPRW